MNDAVNLIQNSKSIMIVCGAGISVACGIPDFRSEGTGLYSQLQAFQLPYPTAMFELASFFKRPRPFYHLSEKIFPDNQFQPSLAHFFFTYLNQQQKLHYVVTQNIDDLEIQAGVPANKVSQAHGSFVKPIVCSGCGMQMQDFLQQKCAARDQAVLHCEACGCALKPQITFFGESLPAECGQYASRVKQADLMIVLGTSLKVAPVNGLPALARQLNIPRILINSEAVGDFGEPGERDIVLLGQVDDVVSRLCSLMNIDISQFRSQNLMKSAANFDVNFANSEKLELCAFKNSMIIPDALTHVIQKEVVMFALSRKDQVDFLKSRSDITVQEVFYEISQLPPQISTQLVVQAGQKLKVQVFSRVIKQADVIVYAPPCCHFNSYVSKYLAYTGNEDVWDLITRYVGTKKDDIIQHDRREVTLQQALYSQIPVDAFVQLISREEHVEESHYSISWKNLQSKPCFDPKITLSQKLSVKFWIQADTDDYIAIADTFENKITQIQQFIFDQMKLTPEVILEKSEKIVLIVIFTNVRQKQEDIFQLLKQGINNIFKKYSTGIKMI